MYSEELLIFFLHIARSYSMDKKLEHRMLFLRV